MCFVSPFGVGHVIDMIVSVCEVNNRIDVIVLTASDINPRGVILNVGELNPDADAYHLGWMQI